jgi:glycosyltransferase involved in cell wall biosynthesis
MNKKLANTKILYVGNLANISYNLAKSLRREGLKVDLFMNNSASSAGGPFAVDKKNSGWVHHFRSGWKPLNFFEIMSRAKKYDIVQGFYSAAIPLQFTGRPYLIYTTGSDFRDLAQKRSPMGFLMARAFRKAKIFLCCQIDHIDLIKSQGYDNVVFLPLSVEIPDNKNSGKVNGGRKSDGNKNTGITILHPTNHVWNYDNGLPCKRNDIFIRGLAEFIKKSGKSGADVKCIMMKRGKDFDKSMSLIEKLGIKNNVQIMGEVSQTRLLELIKESDIVSDQFGLGSFGLIALESMSVKKPVLISINKKLEKIFYGDNSPIPELDTPKKISDYLSYLAGSRENLRKEGEKQYAFVKKYHDSKVVAKKLEKVYEDFAKNYLKKKN